MCIHCYGGDKNGGCFNIFSLSSLLSVSILQSGSPVPHPAGLVLRRPGYYTIPSLEELVEFVNDRGECWVENFAIGREGYGNVCFPGDTNVASLNLDDIGTIFDFCLLII